ncbi:MAG: LamG domain-containing protein [Bacteroidetes bacterium]|nr:LamG domain-containing protein [Bacteroidota bacterium]
MKTTHFLTLLLSFLLLFTSCKKDKKETPPANDPELLGPEAGKVLHYSFNSIAKDGSGNNMDPNSTNNLSFTTDRFGRANQAALFGNGGSTTNIITPSLSGKISGLPVAVSFWVKTDDFTRSQLIAKSDGFERSTYSGYTIYLGAWGNKKISFSFANNTGIGSNAYSIIISPELITANNTWYHVVFNVRSATDYDLYVNNVKYTNCTTGGTATTMVFNPPSVGIMGVYDGTANTNFTGALDDYRVYNRTLSEQEVSTLFNFRP